MISNLSNSYSLNSSYTVEQWYKLNIEKRNELNEEVIRQKILTWDELFDLQKNHVELGLDNHLLFFHIFKTAGTTLNRIIAKNYRINNILQANAPVIDNNPSILFKLKSCARCHMGHVELNDIIYQFLDRKKLINITLLREPLERVVSYYDHIRSRQRHILHDKVKKMSIENFIESDLVNDVNNGQALRLLGLLKQKHHIKDGRDNSELYNDAKKILTECFSIIGTTNQFEHFVINCQILLNWSDIYYQKLNQSTLKTPKLEIRDDVVDKIYKLNEVDLQLFNFVTGLNETRSDELGVDNDVIIEFRKKNQIFNELISCRYRSEI